MNSLIDDINNVIFNSSSVVDIKYIIVDLSFNKLLFFDVNVTKYVLLTSEDIVICFSTFIK